MPNGSKVLNELLDDLYFESLPAIQQHKILQTREYARKHGVPLKCKIGLHCWENGFCKKCGKLKRDY